MTAIENSTTNADSAETVYYPCRKVAITCATGERDGEGSTVDGKRYIVDAMLLQDGRLLVLDAEGGDELFASIEDYVPHADDLLVETVVTDESGEIELEDLIAADQAAVARGNESLLTDEEWDARHWPRSFTVSIDNDGGSEVIEAESLEDAREQAREFARDGDYGDVESTIWVDWTLSAKDKHGNDKEVASGTVAIDPTEPECGHAEGHDWRSPYSLLGGLKENPGVWGHGGGVIIHEVCVRCGCERVTDTWAQRPDNGEQGLRSVRYEEGAHVIDNSLDAIRWNGDVGSWCDRWFVRGDSGAFDSEEEARRAASWRIESRKVGGWWSSDDLEACRGANLFASKEDAEAAIDSLRELGGEWAECEYRAVRVGREG